MAITHYEFYRDDPRFVYANAHFGYYYPNGDENPTIEVTIDSIGMDHLRAVLQPDQARTLYKKLGEAIAECGRAESKPSAMVSDDHVAIKLYGNRYDLDIKEATELTEQLVEAIQFVEETEG